MANKELKRLRRGELLEMLLDQGRRVETLQARLEEAEAKLKSREILLEKAGSIAEAAVQLSGVFEAAQDACQLYIANVEQLSRHQGERNAAREEESRRKAEELLRETERKCRAMEAETQKRCDALLEETQLQIQAKCAELSRRLNVD